MRGERQRILPEDVEEREVCMITRQCDSCGKMIAPVQWVRAEPPLPSGEVRRSLEVIVRILETGKECDLCLACQAKALKVLELKLS